VPGRMLSLLLFFYLFSPATPPFFFPHYSGVPLILKKLLNALTPFVCSDGIGPSIAMSGNLLAVLSNGVLSVSNCNATSCTPLTVTNAVAGSLGSFSPDIVAIAGNLVAAVETSQGVVCVYWCDLTSMSCNAPVYYTGTSASLYGTVLALPIFELRGGCHVDGELEQL